MALETEIKLSLPPHAAALLAAHPLLNGLTPLRQRLLNTYYDTADLQLHDERVAVRYRKKGWIWLFTVKCATPSAGGLARRNEWEVAGSPGEFNFSHVDDKKLRRRLEALRPTLTPVFTTNFMRSAWLLEPQPGVRIELALDRGWIEAENRRTPICEVELELLEGNVADLFHSARLLQADLPLHPEAASKAERGYRLFADAPLLPNKAQALALPAEIPTLAAFRQVALACLGHLQGNEAGARNSDAPAAIEFIHQARVAIRRLRSAIRIWKPLLPVEFTAGFDPRWRNLAICLGESRNWDVFLTETLPTLTAALHADTAAHAGLPRLTRYATRRSTNRRQAARAVLKSVDYSRLLLEFTEAVIALPDGEPGALQAFARHSLNQRSKKIARLAGGALHTDAAARHRLRIAVKHLRYALEFFAALFPGRTLANDHQTATSLQELLGQMNDLAVAAQHIGEALPDRHGAPLLDWMAQRNESLLPELDATLRKHLRPPRSQPSK